VAFAARTPLEDNGSGAQTARRLTPEGQLCGACIGQRVGVVAIARAVGPYRGALRRIIHAFKYRGHRSLAAPLARLLLEAGADLLAHADAVVAVPLHPLKAWTRGFNQADDLARHLPCRRLAALGRRRHTVPQAGLPARARRRNVRHAFAPSWRLQAGRRLSAGWAARALPCSLRRWIGHRWSVAGQVVVLVDDVRTTGATLEECSRILRLWGAREVRALTVARVDRR
jgi:predicted amidophosphoribosyltransferase